MTQGLDERFLSGVLDDLEDLELPLLAWGVTTGSLAHEEVLEAIAGQLLEGQTLLDVAEDEVLAVLLDAALLFRIPATSPPRYRTRMAETVRLTTRLRQLFGPRDLASPPARWWEQGRTLVADYRLHTARRRYPRRNIPVDDALQELARSDAWTAWHTQTARAQLSHPTVARFQVDATWAITNALHAGQSTGVIVGAGTGSGKTLGFYLPAFAAMAEHARKGGGGVHTLALYPRIELLRDQLREAVATALRVNGGLESGTGRRLRIGVLYGDTPQNAQQLQARTSHLARSWTGRSGDAVCPYLACPRCRHNLVWSRKDQAENRDRLRCFHASCGLVIDDVVLTRENLRGNPPDLLFTTTEMLNRNATDPGLGQLLGWRGPRRPSLVLLDEVHTYTGMHGAQVGLLLRRWRHAVRSTVTFVGLSATLRDAAAFFAQLTGLPDVSVDYVTPQAEDLEEEGREYAIAVRADPVSGASQLSTSIQTAMLYGRVLDLRGREMLYGSRGFLFTDDLDVTNRFYDDLRDAEGGGTRRGQRRAGRVLAGLRSPDAPFRAERFTDGQSWDLVRQVGRDLDPDAVVGELRVGRTSSQDVGVDYDADLVVATASLEVGYDDDRVGLVLQHKAPHDAAAFIQRRGRAGRRRGTRPWTVITLSDYGRDRLAYQAYDALFSPELTARRLPVRNRFVLKIQGAQALLDWLAATLPQARIDPRRLLTAPRPDARPADSGQEQALADLLERLITDQALQDSLMVHLRRALGISADEAQALLWEQPRALLLSVAPTALRRLRCRWRPVDPDPGAHPGSLLPEFLTTALYQPLNVPEVNFRLPFTEEAEALPIERALREAVPGRVSRRYGHRRSNDRTWLPLPAGGANGTLEITSFVETHSPQGAWTPAGHQPVQVFRPYVMALQQPPGEIADRSQGVPVWGSEILEPASGLYAANIPKPSAWTDRITAVGFATSAAGNPAEVRRMTLGAECETTYERGTTRTITSSVRYSMDGQSAALGFRLNVDAVRFDLAPLDVTRKAVAEHLRSPEWRLLALTSAMAQDPALDGIANSFQRNWLTTVYMAAYALAATEPGMAGSSGERVHASLHGGAWRNNIQQILRALYRDAGAGAAAAPDRLVAGLTDLSTDARLTDRLDRHARLLWADDVGHLTTDLAQRVYRDTVAAAILAATQRACPDAQDRDLIVDVVPSAEGDGRAAIWLTETSLGGVGIIEQLVRYYAENPRRFWGLVDSALGPSDHDYVHSTVVQLLDHVVSQPSGTAAQAMSALREAPSAHAADAALQQLRSAWAALAGHPRHQAIAALSTRLLRPGTTSATDATVLGLIRAWDGLQQRLGFEVEGAVFAYMVGTGRLAVPGADGTSLTADQVFSLLWPRGSKARVQHLQHYQPYAGTQIIDRLLAQAAHDERLPVVNVDYPDWLAAYTAAIRDRGAVVLVAPVQQTQTFGAALRTVPAVTIDRDVLRLYGDVRAVARDGGYLRATIEIREAAQ
ncbi:protein DpdJ [Micromonospora sp. NPDC049497]|uniref:protein DpdJ n=1 Tax=Micromonospora sp. NPDC049497 TaxID=3364273 RepID=UPI0037BBAC21